MSESTLRIVTFARGKKGFLSKTHLQYSGNVFPLKQGSNRLHRNLRVISISLHMVCNNFINSLENPEKLSGSMYKYRSVAQKSYNIHGIGDANATFLIASFLSLKLFPPVFGTSSSVPRHRRFRCSACPRIHKPA